MQHQRASSASSWLTGLQLTTRGRGLSTAGTMSVDSIHMQLIFGETLTCTYSPPPDYR